MNNRLHHQMPYPPDEALEDLRRKVHALLDEREVSRWKLLQAEWLYDLALLTNDFRIWMQRLDRGFDTSR
jgi:hypothetical protein